MSKVVNLEIRHQLVTPPDQVIATMPRLLKDVATLVLDIETRNQVANMETEQIPAWKMFVHPGTVMTESQSVVQHAPDTKLA